MLTKLKNYHHLRLYQPKHPVAANQTRLPQILRLAQLGTTSEVVFCCLNYVE